MSEKPKSIRVVCATRLPQKAFLTQSLTGFSLRAFVPASPIELTLFPENQRGLAEVYNMAIERFLNEDSILVFVHDDVLFMDYHWSEVVRAGLNAFGIVGVVGNIRRQRNQPGWVVTDLRGTLDDYAFLSGSVGQGNAFPPERLDVFGPVGRECKLMDGLFLAVETETLRRTGLRFDPQFKFHFYDVDFCREAERLGVSMGTIPLAVSHGSSGPLSKAWKETYPAYLDKWKD
jgi:GT2 family glycosyltransferase